METTMSGRWAVPGFGILMGVALMAAATIGGQPALGVGMFAVMAIYSGLVVGLSGRSEIVGVLRGQPADERLASFNLNATAIAGTVAIVVAIAGFLWETAQGRSGADFAVVAATAGVGYLVALVWMRWRG